jgi:hypothetical protein
MSEYSSLLVWVVGGALVLVAVLIVTIAVRGRQLAGEHVFRASRWSRGNHLFPTQVAITPEAVLHHTPQWFGRREQSIHMAHVSSVEVDTNLFFANVVIETSGGSEPVRCYGHRKRDAVDMKRLITRYQSEYYGPNRQAKHV